MKTIRYILYIPIIYIIIGLIYTLLPFTLMALFDLSKFWLIFLVIFFGGFLLALFAFLPGAIGWLSAKISPNKEFAFYTTLLISIILGSYQIFSIWTNSDLKDIELSLLIRIILTSLTVGIGISLSIGSGVDLTETENGIVPVLLFMGSLVFYLGIFLLFCLLSTEICIINPTKNYTWYSGIWHGIFAIPNWIISWFSSDIYCKAPLSTFAYSVFWWLSLIFIGLSIFGGSRRPSY
jgi:hypothetical protein